MRCTRRHSIPHDCLTGLAERFVLAPLTAVLVPCGGDDGSSAPAYKTLLAIEVKATQEFSGVGLTLQLKATRTYAAASTANVTALLAT
jgi:hypothetical protein